MRNILICIFSIGLIFSSSLIVNGQKKFKPALTLEQFRKWSTRVKLPGFEHYITEQNINAKDSSVSYMSIFRSADANLIVILSHEKDYLNYKKTTDTSKVKPYMYKGFKCVNYPLMSEAGLYTIASLHIPHQKTALCFTYSQMLGKEKMLALIQGFDLSIYTPKNTAKPNQNTTLASQVSSKSQAISKNAEVKKKAKATTKAHSPEVKKDSVVKKPSIVTDENTPVQGGWWWGY